MMSSKNPKDFSMIEIQPEFYVSTYLFKADELRAKIKKSLDRNEISLREINEDGDTMEEASMVSLKNLVGFSVQLGSGVTQLMHAGKDPDEDDSEPDSEREKPIYAFCRSEIYNGWIIGKLAKTINSVEVSRPDYVVVKKEFAKVVENSVDNYITASLDWVIEAIMEDFSEMFPDADQEEFDDGE